MILSRYIVVFIEVSLKRQQMLPASAMLAMSFIKGMQGSVIGKKSISLLHIKKWNVRYRHCCINSTLLLY